MYRPNKSIVLAAERMPAQFRPGNQAVLVRSAAANRSYSDPRDFVPGMGAVQDGNGTGDNGLSPGGSNRRLQAFRSFLDAQKLQDAGSPNANPGDAVMYTTTEALMAQMPSSGSAQVIARVPRDQSSAWEVVKRTSFTGQPVYTADLVHEGETTFVSDELATETDARNFVQAQQFSRSFLDNKPSPRGSAFNRDLFAKTSPFRKPANVNAATASSQALVPFVDSPAPVLPTSYQPGGNVSNLTQNEIDRLQMDGLDTTTGAAIGLGVVGLAALFLIFRR